MARDTNHPDQRHTLLITLHFPPFPSDFILVAHNHSIVSCLFELIVVFVQGFGLPTKQDTPRVSLEKRSNTQCQLVWCTMTLDKRRKRPVQRGSLDTVLQDHSLIASLSGLYVTLG